jgi:hypothetical protein
VNMEGVPAHICLLAKNSLTDSVLQWASLEHFCTHLPHVKIFI